MVALRRSLPYPHATPVTSLGPFLRTWLRHLDGRMQVVDGHTYFLLVKEKEVWSGQMWARLEQPYGLKLTRHYALDVSLWHGPSLADATQQPLRQGSANAGKALVLNWPGAGDGGRVVVSRLLGMSLLFDKDHWSRAALCRYDQRLVVHHKDDRHENCFLGNLEVKYRPLHTAEHNRQR